MSTSRHGEHDRALALARAQAALQGADPVGGAAPPPPRPRRRRPRAPIARTLARVQASRTSAISPAGQRGERPAREAQVEAHAERHGGRRGGRAQARPALAIAGERAQSTRPIAASAPVAFQ